MKKKEKKEGKFKKPIQCSTSTSLSFFHSLDLSYIPLNGRGVQYFGPLLLARGMGFHRSVSVGSPRK